MDMNDGTVWVDPDRPAVVRAGEVPELRDVFCWNCQSRELDYVVDVTDMLGYHARVGMCEQCFNDCSKAEGWMIVDGRNYE